LSKRKTVKPVVKPGRPRSTGSLDVYFGEKLRARRLMMVPKVSQEELGAALGITFQQVQKYENGKNRVSAALMVRMAKVLEVDVQYFFDDLPVRRKEYQGDQDACPHRDVPCFSRPSHVGRSTVDITIA
jgi:DNA-binding XRE family transcriptional regulator